MILRQSFKLWITFINDIKVKSFFGKSGTLKECQPVSELISKRALRVVLSAQNMIGSVDACVQHIRSLNNGLFNRKKKMETRRNQAWWSFFSFFSSFYPISWLGKSFKNHQNLVDISFEKRLTRCQVALHTSLVRDIYNVSRSAGHEVFSEEHVNFVWSNWQLCCKQWLFPAILNMRFTLYSFTVKW